MKALELLKHALKGYSVHEKNIDEAIAELEELELKYDTQEIYIDDLRKELERMAKDTSELQEELRITNEAYAILLKQYHDLKDKE